MLQCLCCQSCIFQSQTEIISIVKKEKIFLENQTFIQHFMKYLFRQAQKQAQVSFYKQMKGEQKRGGLSA